MNATKAPQGKVAVDHPPTADHEHGCLSQEWKGREDRAVERPVACRARRLLEERLDPASEFSRDAILLCERLDDVDADDRLLGARCDRAEALLNLAQDGVRRPAEQESDGQHGRSNCECDQRQLPVENEQNDRYTDDREDVLRQKNQAVAEEEANVLQVGGGSRHELAGLEAVEEAEREPQQM